MRHYETIFLLKPTLTEEETKAKIDFFRKLITDNDGEIAGFDDIGIRQLAYEINHIKRGYYYVIYYKTSNYSLPDELQRVFRITEDVLKFMTLKFEKQIELKAWNDMVNKVPAKQIVKPEYKKETRDYRGRDNRGRDDRGRDNRDNRGRDDRGRDDREQKPNDKPSETTTDATEPKSDS